MSQIWKAPHILKGALTRLPALNRWRQRHASTAGSDSPRYCYSVWLRHLTLLSAQGFKIQGARIGELGPGDSIGAGIAALLSGADRYVGLDVVPFSAKANLQKTLEELTRLYRDHEPIPNYEEFPRVRPTLNSYDFPEHVVHWPRFAVRVEALKREVKSDWCQGRMIEYKAPWDSPDAIAEASLDLIFSQAVLEHVDNLPKTYQSMALWLKPGGYGSHVIDFGAHHLSPYWNGHWAYSDLEWRIVRGRREFLLNREPLSTHLSCAAQAGFEVLMVNPESDDHGLEFNSLSQGFRTFGAEDLRTRGVVLILRKKPF